MIFKISVARERVNFPRKCKSSADLMFSIKGKLGLNIKSDFRDVDFRNAKYTILSDNSHDSHLTVSA